MKTKTGPSIDRAAFEKLRRIAPNLLESRRAGADGDWRARPLPEELAFKLTNRCDLRCDHCYQWNDSGYHHGLSAAQLRGDLDLAIIAKVLAATRPLKSNVILWGGEPLVYRDWDGLVELLVAEERWTSVCTNGTQIERRLGSLLRLSERLEMVIAVDGFEAEHDALRGKGAYQRMMKGLRALVAQRKAGAFRGEITVNCVFQDSMVERLFDLVSHLQDEGIDTLYLSFPWYLADEAAAMMDAHVAAHFPWLMTPGGGGRQPSWHSYTFRLDPARFNALHAQLDRIDAAQWRVKVRYNPELHGDEMREFLLGSHRPAQGKTRCLSLRSRMDIFPGGEVVSCKFFPEFSVGNLTQAEVAEVWHGSRFTQVRETISRCGLMPACSKCPLLYTRGA